MLSRQTNRFSLTLINGKYFFVEVKNDVEFELDDLKELIEFQKELGEGKALPVLIYPSPSATTNSDVLKYMAKSENVPFTKCDAFVLHSIPQKILAKFYTRLLSPGRPTEFFTRQEEALKWLQNFFE